MIEEFTEKCISWEFPIPLPKLCVVLRHNELKMKQVNWNKMHRIPFTLGA
jgi:hypothetical protein